MLPMKYSIVLTASTAERIRKESSNSNSVPRSDLKLLAESLNATFIEQQPSPVEVIDRINAKLSGTQENWAFARFLAPQLSSDDVVFCPGEEIGIPLASACSRMKERPKIIVWFHRITGLRTRIALKLFNIANLVDLSVVNTFPNRDFLNSSFDLSDKEICFLWHPIDCSYYQPGIASSDKTRPIVVSIGLEQRDYRLLAAATETLDVDVRVAGFSQFQSRIAKCFPQVMPENMTNQRYSWSELIQLYNDANVVVVSLKENDGAAGVTALLEAMACKKAIVCVRTKGISAYLPDEETVMTVEPGDAAGLQAAILYLLNNPQESKLRAERAYELVWAKHDLEKQVRVLTEFVRSVEVKSQEADKYLCRN